MRNSKTEIRKVKTRTLEKQPLDSRGERVRHPKARETQEPTLCKSRKGWGPPSRVGSQARPGRSKDRPLHRRQAHAATNKKPASGRNRRGSAGERYADLQPVGSPPLAIDHRKRPRSRRAACTRTTRVAAEKTGPASPWRKALGASDRRSLILRELG